MTKETALVSLLTEVFSTQESLKRFVYLLPTQDANIPRAIEASSIELMAHRFVDELRRRGLIDQAFFARLVQEFPNYESQIRNVEHQWVIESDEWSRRPPTREPPTYGKANAPKVLVSYARADVAFFEEISAHLSILQRKGLIQLWHEGRISAGEAWADANWSEIQSSDIFILLVSADFLASGFVWDCELPLILKRQQEGKATVIPIIIRPCLWLGSPLAKFQALPSDGKPLALSQNPDKAWLAIAKQVENVARRLGSAE
jgi:TIR domain